MNRWKIVSSSSKISITDFYNFVSLITKNILKILLISYISLLSADAVCQQNWYWINPLPQGNKLNSSSFVNAYTGYAVGSGGAFMKTTNGGDNWMLADINCVYDLKSVNFVNANTGFILTTQNILYKTTNSGVIWDSVTKLSVTNSKVFFNDSNFGILVGDTSVIYKTTNGGISWSFVYNVQQITASFKDVCFTREGGVFCAGNYSLTGPYTYYYGFTVNSFDNGNTWIFKMIINASSNHDVGSICFINNDTGFVTGSGAYLATTSNGGTTWSFSHYFGTCNFSKLKFFNVSTGYVIGADNTTTYIYRTTTGGQYWYNSQQPYSVNNYQFLDTNTILAVGGSGQIIKSTNSGLNWSSKKSSFITDRLTCVFPVTENTVYAGGTNGKIIKSTNGGRNWNHQQSGIQNFITSMFFSDSLTGTATSPFYILRTTNGGSNWNMQYTSTKYIESVFYFDNNTGFACGRNLLLMKTTNGGSNWESFNIDVLPWQISNFTKITFINNQTGFLLGWNASGVPAPSVFKTTNRGQNWTGYYGPIWGKDVKFINENTGVTVGSEGEICRTTDGGMNWSNYSGFPEYYEFSGLAFINSTTGYIVGNNRLTLYKTTNTGLNWFLDYTGLTTDDWLWGIASFNGKAFFVGEFGIMKTTKQFNSIFINNEATTEPRRYLLLQNFPNPFNPVSKIKYQVPELSAVNISVYDLTGRLIATLVDKRLAAGTYEAVFDGAGLSSGVYFCRLVAGSFAQTVRMIITK